MDSVSCFLAVFSIGLSISTVQPRTLSSDAGVSLLAPSGGASRPLVCYEGERDQLRQILIQWLERKQHSIELTMKGSEIEDDPLSGVFNECDLSKDGRIDAYEFAACVEKNTTVRGPQADKLGHILRGLCLDALIVVADQDSDWALDKKEFQTCLDPSFTPAARKCSLEGKDYEDGAETKVGCNSCICACGNWMCSATQCRSLDWRKFRNYAVHQSTLPDQSEREALLRGFMTDDVEVYSPPLEGTSLYQWKLRGHQSEVERYLQILREQVVMPNLDEDMDDGSGEIVSGDIMM